MAGTFWCLELYIVKVKTFGCHYVPFPTGRVILFANIKYKCIVRVCVCVCVLACVKETKLKVS